MILTIVFGEDHKNLKHLEEIAKLGGTGKVYKEKTFKGLDDLFKKIAINPSYGLKIK